MFCDKYSLTFPTYILNQKLETLMVLLLVTNENKSYYIYISKILMGVCFRKRKIKTKNTIVKVVYSVYSNNLLTEHR